MLLPNPGGRLSCEAIIGRTNEISRYWKILERQGLVLAAERRIGKTSIVRKMQAHELDGFHLIYQDLEHVHSLVELVRAVYRSVGEHLELSRSQRIKATALDLWSKLAPKSIGEINVPQAADRWKDLLTAAVDDALSVFEDGEKVVFVWDEFPLMLFNISQRAGADAAIQLLDLLRQLRQSRAQLRFLFTGSVGLHLVLRELRIAKNANAPVNDMQSETVPAMSRGDTFELAERLLAGFERRPLNIAATVERMFDRIGGYPFYIHHAADQLEQIDRPVTPDDVDAVIEDLLLSSEDPAQFAYHAERIRTYYNPAEGDLAFAVLNAVAGNGPLPMPKLINLVRHQKVNAHDDNVRSICHLLRQDHYLELKKPGGATLHGFRWPLLKRWWQENRL